MGWRHLPRWAPEVVEVAALEYSVDVPGVGLSHRTVGHGRRESAGQRLPEGEGVFVVAGEVERSAHGDGDGRGLASVEASPLAVRAPGSPAGAPEMGGRRWQEHRASSHLAQRPKTRPRSTLAWGFGSSMPQRDEWSSPIGSVGGRPVPGNRLVRHPPPIAWAKASVGGPIRTRRPPSCCGRNWRWRVDGPGDQERRSSTGHAGSPSRISGSPVRRVAPWAIAVATANASAYAMGYTAFR